MLWLQSTIHSVEDIRKNFEFEKGSRDRNNSARNKDQKLVGRFLKIGYFYRLLIYCSIENVQEIWPTKMDFGQPNAEIGWKMANGQLLFLALQ